ncbi:unnamed protein product [Kuraishia capsulata CBS 1993]|uniref:ORC6 first cyclin-like domain-containing protein n=1 Tax=Kuraishia capsulata CBS 1993 TaxID=1382522 RepID=W6MXY3_9ASCO|nr:uncharacterized protein KUCA_T00005678001 [Kuraishia capsulata CBS 1993]CDK29685.1 unnamed protein product [Kuraishia capsulata CBS 1993]
MTSRLIQQAIQDVIPSQDKPYPPQLISYATTLSLTSTQKSKFLQGGYEFAKYHLSVYAAVVQLKERLNLPDPTTDKIPIPPKQVNNIVNSFLQLIIDPASNPTTPRKRRMTPSLTPSTRSSKKRNVNTQLATPESTPTKPKVVQSLKDADETSLKSANNVNDVTKKLLDLADAENSEDVIDEDDIFDSQEEFDYGSEEDPDEISDQEYTEPGIKIHTPRASPARRVGRPRKVIEDADSQSPADSTPKKRGRPRKHPLPEETGIALKGNSALIDVQIESTKKPMTLKQLETFCRRLDIPLATIQNIILSFNEFRNRIKNEWALLCGLVAVAYTRLYHSECNSEIGVKKSFYDNLHELQNGGLRKQDLGYWVGVVERLVSSKQWVRNLEMVSGNPEKWMELPTIGDMVSASVRYTSHAYLKMFEDWKMAFCAEFEIKL